jgi:phospholipid-binding lipoprotein MlaA
MQSRLAMLEDIGGLVTVGRQVLPLLAVGALLAGCATAPPKSNKLAYEAYQQQNDPLQPANRVFYRFDNALDTHVLKPVAIGYRDITTPGIRHHVSDFLVNLEEPGDLVNFMAEGKSRLAGTALVRFLVNSTIGIGGLFDPAGVMGYHTTYTDTGLTLADWGVGEGPYLYLPLFGPSDVRDASALPAGIVLSPTFAAPASAALKAFNYGSSGVNVVNEREQLLGTVSQIKSQALDPYATFRSLYRQHRVSELKTIRQRNVLTVPAWYSPKVRAEMQRAVDQAHGTNQ